MSKGQSKADQIRESKLRTSGKLEKDDMSVVYMGPDNGPFKCGRCEYFIKPNGCEKVEGHIEAEGCCNLFEPEDDS